MRTVADAEYPSYLKLYREGILERRASQLNEIYRHCRLCPRDCAVNRTEGELGRCGASGQLKVSSAFPHFGEERPLVGQNGSGTIFFSHCGLKCVYCQNHEISFDGQGEKVSEMGLAKIMVALQKLGCHNINLVTPTHYLPGIIAALKTAIEMGLTLPLVYNSGGYEKPEILSYLEGIIDIYMPDFKYWESEKAALYSSGASNYPQYARDSLKEMHRQVGDLVLDWRGIAVRGLLIRHLVLPNRAAGTKAIMSFIANEISSRSYVNVMRQYRPEHEGYLCQEINRRLSENEYREAVDWAHEAGLYRLDR